MNHQSTPVLRNLIILNILLIAFVACKDKERVPQIHKIEKHIKDWMFFDTSSWWVYKELNSGILDSQYITKSELITYDSKPNNKNEPYIISQSAKIYNSSGFLFLISSTFGGSTIEKMSSSVGTYLYYKPVEIGSRKGSGLGYIEMVAIDPNFTLDGNKYDTMITLLENHDLSEGGDSVEYKFFKGVGIINKKNITKNQNWKLIKYHIKMNKN